VADKRIRWGWLVLAALVAGWLYWMTLRPNLAVATDLAPLTTSAARRGISAYWLIDIAGNMVVFAPLGACVALALETRSLRTRLLLATLCGLLLSASIEWLQLAIPDRITAWEDLMLNAAGALLGALGACGVQFVLKNK